MAVPEHQNFVSGSWGPSLDAGRFFVRDPLAPERVLGSWPRSGASEIAALAESWAREPLGWALSERRAVLARAAERIERDGDGAVLCAASLGLDEAEWSRHRSGLGDALSDEPPRPAPPGTSVLCMHWSELLGGLWLRLASELLAGQRVLCLADERLPAAPELVVRALLEEGAPPGALALLHGAQAELVERALELVDAQALVGSGSAERVHRLARAAARRGVEERLEVVHAGARELDEHEDLEQAASEVAERAFGRATALSGQLRDQVGRVFCPERRLSAFTDALLAALADSPDVARPLPFVSAEEASAAHRLRTSGLDEGATLIFGSALLDADRPGLAHPLVFTNVEPFMDCARRQEPAPVLCLLRVSGTIRF